ncbi:hypothetical protein Sru01_40120 [Sphaerisporangium rufum]|uniref:Transmembrane protein n=1 Tax=Sphaerisporangium rufum TaxID=1381558 RepID=A0A919R675_9ACTN|nr:hypothetical protein [Sphaerisporangium rufum]GII79030.1 hypothetical protein Sru01_40120 [Sphaerisporangium rufum]
MDDHDLSADQALREIGRMRREVRRSENWAGRLFLVAGLAVILYWTAMFLLPDPAPAIAAVLWVALTGASFVYAVRQGVQGAEYRRLEWPVTFAWLATMVGAVLFGGFLLPDEPAGWWVAAALAVALCTAVPPLWAAWWLLRRKAER